MSLLEDESNQRQAAASEYKEQLQKLIGAAGFDADRTTPGLFQLLGYRKRVAEELLHGFNSDKQTEMLQQVYDKTEKEIKLLLSL